MLNFNEASETTITIFIQDMEHLSVCWSGHVRETELMTYACVRVGGYARLLISA